MKRLLLIGLLVLGTGLAQAENLPDFTDIVDHESNTVVNISAVTKRNSDIRRLECR